MAFDLDDEELEMTRTLINRLPPKDRKVNKDVNKDEQDTDELSSMLRGANNEVSRR